MKIQQKIVKKVGKNFTKKEEPASLYGVPVRKDGNIVLPWYERFKFMATKANKGNGWDIVLTGPSSSGKTWAVYMLARDLGWDIVVQQGHRRIEVEELRGTRSIIAGKSGMPITGFDPGTLTKALQMCAECPGVVFLFDELNLLDAGMLNMTNNLTQRDEHSALVVPELGITIPRPKNFLFVGTMNPEYEAVNHLSEAFLSRIVKIECPMMNLQQVRAILSMRCGAPRDMVDVASRSMNYIETARRNEQHQWEPDLRTMIQFLDAWVYTEPQWKKGDPLDKMSIVFDEIIGPKIGWKDTFYPTRKGLRDAIVVSLGGIIREEQLGDLMMPDVDDMEGLDTTFSDSPISVHDDEHDA